MGSDSGHYTCTASAESGETSWSASLTVRNMVHRLQGSAVIFFLSLLVHRVSKRKTFHFLHYDYEKLFQFILISMCFASQSVSSSTDWVRCWNFRRITLAESLRIDRSAEVLWTYTFVFILFCWGRRLAIGTEFMFSFWWLHRMKRTNAVVGEPQADDPTCT